MQQSCFRVATVRATDRDGITNQAVSEVAAKPSHSGAPTFPVPANPITIHLSRAWICRDETAIIRAAWAPESDPQPS